MINLKTGDFGFDDLKISSNLSLDEFRKSNFFMKYGFDKTDYKKYYPLPLLNFKGEKIQVALFFNYFQYIDKIKLTVDGLAGSYENESHFMKIMGSFLAFQTEDTNFLSLEKNRLFEMHKVNEEWGQITHNTADWKITTVIQYDRAKSVKLLNEMLDSDDDSSNLMFGVCFYLEDEINRIKSCIAGQGGCSGIDFLSQDKVDKSKSLAYNTFLKLEDDYKWDMTIYETILEYCNGDELEEIYFSLKMEHQSSPIIIRRLCKNKNVSAVLALYHKLDKSLAQEVDVVCEFIRYCPSDEVDSFYQSLNTEVKYNSKVVNGFIYSAAYNTKSRNRAERIFSFYCSLDSKLLIDVGVVKEMIERLYDDDLLFYYNSLPPTVKNHRDVLLSIVDNFRSTTLISFYKSLDQTSKVDAEVLSLVLRNLHDNDIVEFYKIIDKNTLIVNKIASDLINKLPMEFVCDLITHLDESQVDDLKFEITYRYENSDIKYIVDDKEFTLKYIDRYSSAIYKTLSDDVFGDNDVIKNNFNAIYTTVGHVSVDKGPKDDFCEWSNRLFMNYYYQLNSRLGDNWHYGRGEFIENIYNSCKYVDEKSKTSSVFYKFCERYNAESSC